MMKNRLLLSAAFSGLALAAFAQTETTTAAPMADMDAATFVTMAASGNMYEIQSSELATTKSSDPELLEFAAQMIADHTKAGEELAAAAADVPPPAAMDPKHAEMVAQLEAADAASFDQLYIEQQIAAHVETEALLASFAGNGDDEALKAFATKTLPVVQMHGDHIERMAAE